MKKIIPWIFIGVLIGEVIYNFFFNGEFKVFRILFLTFAISSGFYLGKLIDSRKETR